MASRRAAPRAAVIAALAASGALLAGLEAAQTPASPPARDAKLETLVARTCSPCHVPPRPEILPQRAWKAVVDDMMALIVEGVGAPRGVSIPPADFDPQQIAHYYESRAPAALPSPAAWPAPESDAPRFVRRSLAYPGSDQPAAVANVRLLGLGAGPEVVAADMLSGLVLSSSGAAGASGMRLLARLAHPCHTEAVDLDRDTRIDLVVADLGEPRPSDRAQGSVTWLRRQADGSFQALALASRLPRVADVQPGDFDGDGDLDLVVAAFGWRRVGGILLLENRTEDWSRPVFVPRELDDRSGAIHVPPLDLDKDGRLDFVALISQHHELVVAFLGDGKGGFRKQVVDQAPHPGWGSSGLQLADMDADGDADVLVSNGDMLDDYQLKPYHGIRWLENRGGFPFVAHELSPMFGVMRAQAADLDADGDTDVVACAMAQFKPDGGAAVRPPDLPSLVWLERTAGGHFERHTLERGGQHLSLDLGDYDADGDVDIVVANSLSHREGHVDVWENAGRRGTIGGTRP